MSEVKKMIAKAIIKRSGCICASIDQYLEKADNDLEKSLKSGGFVDAKKTVKAMNHVEDELTQILEKQTNELVAKLESSSRNWIRARKKIDKWMDSDTIGDEVEALTEDMLREIVPKLANTYILQTDTEMAVDTLRRTTREWIASWSSRLGELMRIETHKAITGLIQETIDTGNSIQSLTKKILDGGWRNERYQAKRVAVTEVLRAHSVAAEEAIQQSPAVDRKEWRHTGAHKNQPRENHVAMDGQIVMKYEPFTLIGIDGGVYYPDYPRDSLLPASESVSCHCIHRGIVNNEILGLSYEERKRIQQEVLDADER